MKRYHFTVILLSLLFIVSCKQQYQVVQDTIPPFNNQLTLAEKTAGVMSPEIMWKFGRLGTFSLSPDGSSVVYTVTDIDLQSEARRTNIFKLSTSGGDPVQVTNNGGDSPQWIDKGKSIAFVNKGNLYTMNADGSNQKKISGIADFEIFNVSPAGDKIYFTKRVKLDQTANEKHNLPKARVRIINNLLYRHWNYWSNRCDGSDRCERRDGRDRSNRCHRRYRRHWCHWCDGRDRGHRRDRRYRCDGCDGCHRGHGIYRGYRIYRCYWIYG